MFVATHLDFTLIMSNTTVFHQIIQSGEVEKPVFETKRENGIWTAACVFRDVYYLQTDPQLKVAKDKVYGAILADTEMQPKLAGSIAKRDLLNKGWVIDFTATHKVGVVVADITFFSPHDLENSKVDSPLYSRRESFTGDSIGSLDRFIKSICADIIAQLTRKTA